MAAIDVAIGDIHEARGVIPRAIESYERALAAVTSREARAALKAKVGNAYVPVGDPRGLAYLEQAIAELNPKTQTNALALATALVGRYYHYRTEHKKAIEYLDRARQLAEPLDDPATLGTVYGIPGRGASASAALDESDVWARAAIALGERTRPRQRLPSGNEFLAENSAARGRWDDALAYAAKGAEEGRKAGSLARVAWSEFSRVQALHGKGELADALEGTQAALELCAQIGEERLATWLDTAAALIAADLGNDTLARTHAERGWARAQRLDQLVLSAWALNALGYVAALRGDASEAIEWYERYAVVVARYRKRRRAPPDPRARGRGPPASPDAWRTLRGLPTRRSRLAEFAGAAALSPRVGQRVRGTYWVAQENTPPPQRKLSTRRSRHWSAAAVSWSTRGRGFIARRSSLPHGDAAQREAARADAAAARAAFVAMGALRDAALAERLLGE